MEPNKNLRLFVKLIITYCILISLISSVQSECVPFESSYMAKSHKLSNPSEGSESPAPSPETSIENVSVSPAPSANAPAEEEAPSQSPADGESPSPSPTTSPTEFSDLKTVCGKTDFPSLCESTINPLLKGKKPDLISVLQLSIQASIGSTKTAMTDVNKLTDSDCKELYDDALTNLSDAIDAIKSRDMDTVNTKLSAALTDYSTCNDGFEETGDPNPLASVGVKLMQMASNSLAISTLVK